MQADLIAGTKFPAPIGVAAGLELTTPLGSTKLLQGGVRYVDTIAQRNAIPEIFREWRMIVGVEETGLDYKLKLGKSSSDLSDNGNWQLMLEVPEIGSGDIGKLLRASATDELEWGPVISDWKPLTMLGTSGVNYTPVTTLRYKLIDSLILLDGIITFITVSGYSHATLGQGFVFGSMPAADVGTGGVKDVLLTKRIVAGSDALSLGAYVRFIISSGGNLTISTINDLEIDNTGSNPTKTDPRRALTSIYTTSDSYTRHDNTTAAYPTNFNGADSEQLSGFTLDLRGLTIARSL